MAWVTSPSTFALAGLIVVALAVYRAIVRGTLVPKATMDRRESDWAQRLAEVQKVAEDRLAETREREQIWRTAHGESEAARMILSEQVEKMTIQGEATLALLNALPKATKT